MFNAVTCPISAAGLLAVAVPPIFFAQIWHPQDVSLGNSAALTHRYVW
jgi:hypothetical protein